MGRWEGRTRGGLDVRRLGGGRSFQRGLFKMTELIGFIKLIGLYSLEAGKHRNWDLGLGRWEGGKRKANGAGESSKVKSEQGQFEADSLEGFN